MDAIFAVGVRWTIWETHRAAPTPSPASPVATSPKGAGLTEVSFAIRPDLPSQHSITKESFAICGETAGETMKALNSEGNFRYGGPIPRYVNH